MNDGVYPGRTADLLAIRVLDGDGRGVFALVDLKRDVVPKVKVGLAI